MSDIVSEEEFTHFDRSYRLLYLFRKLQEITITMTAVSDALTVVQTAQTAHAAALANLFAILTDPTTGVVAKLNELAADETAEAGEAQALTALADSITASTQQVQDSGTAVATAVAAVPPVV